jgi:hypothetical protein
MTMPAIAVGWEVETLPRTAEESVGSVAEAVAMDPEAVMEDCWAHARPKTAERMVALEKYMLTSVCDDGSCRGFGIKYAIRVAMLSLVKRVEGRLALWGRKKVANWTSQVCIKDCEEVSKER